MNVVATDWSHGNGFPYGQAVANIPVVATAIVRQLKAMVAVGLKLDQVHLIGHSLGAHIAGYVGQMMRTIERITALGMKFSSIEELFSKKKSRLIRSGKFVFRRCKNR